MYANDAALGGQIGAREADVARAQGRPRRAAEQTTSTRRQALVGYRRGVGRRADRGQERVRERPGARCAQAAAQAASAPRDGAREANAR